MTGLLVAPNRRWNDYERGIGNIDGDYWLGLTSLHQLLQLNGANELRIELKDYSGRMPSTVVLMWETPIPSTR